MLIDSLNPMDSAFTCDLLIIHYNNPSALNATLLNISPHRRYFKNVSIHDNGSNLESRKAVEMSCETYGFKLIHSPNIGWGSAINLYIKSCLSARESSDFLFVMSHDAIIQRINFQTLSKFAKDPRVFAISAQYSSPLFCYYNSWRSFVCFPDNRKLAPLIGHGTGCLFRVSLIKKVLFDEEYFIYGCESEVFLRMPGLSRIAFSNEFIVDNPSTDSPSDFRCRAFTINSLYTAAKHGGIIGYAKRVFVVLVSSCKLMASSYSRSLGVIKISCLVWSLMHYRKGLRTYLGK